MKRKPKRRKVALVYSDVDEPTDRLVDLFYTHQEAWAEMKVRNLLIMQHWTRRDRQPPFYYVPTTNLTPPDHLREEDWD